MTRIRSLALDVERGHFIISGFDQVGVSARENQRLWVYVNYSNTDLSLLGPTTLPALAAILGPSVKLLDLKGKCGLSLGQWRDTLTCWPNVDCIHIELGGNVTSLFEALRLPPVGSLLDVVSPRLRAIHIYMFRRDNTDISLDAVAHCLETRLALGKRLELLKVRNRIWKDDAGDEYKYKIASMVGTLEWDVYCYKRARNDVH